VAWLAELFDDRVQREKVLGYTQAFSSIGGLLVAVVNGLIAQYVMHLPALSVPEFLQPLIGNLPAANQPPVWRYTLMSGLIPAIPLILIRPFLPESPKWEAKRAAGTLRRPSFRQLFGPGLQHTTIVTAIMVACSYGVAFGAIQQLPQIVPGIDTVRERIRVVTADKPAAEAKALTGKTTQEIIANYTKAQETGGLLGRFALALIVAHVASRRALLRMFLVPSLVLLPLVFWLFSRGHEVVYYSFEMDWLPGFHRVSISMLGIGIAVAGFLTVAQFSFWGNYLPYVYPVHLRGTGESFAANIGGRMFGTPFAYVTQHIAGMLVVQGAATPIETSRSIAVVAACVAFALILVNLLLSFILPEPKHEMISE
jgi:MFS family permease